MKFANRATNSLDIDLTPVEHSPRLHCLGFVVGTFVLQEGGSFQAYIFTYLFTVYSIADWTFFLYIYISPCILLHPYFTVGMVLTRACVRTTPNLPLWNSQSWSHYTRKKKNCSHVFSWAVVSFSLKHP